MDIFNSNNQYCRVGAVVQKVSRQNLSKKECKGICNPVPVIGYPAEYCEDCDKSI
jgi:hypothetical protein